MVACDACGSSLPPGVEFCPVCAAPVTQPAEAQAYDDVAAQAGAPADYASRAEPTSSGGTDVELASPWRRLGAFVIDQAVVTAPVWFFVMVRFAGMTPEEIVAAAATLPLVNLIPLLGWVALMIAEGSTGRTIGNALLGTRTVGEATLRPVGFGKIFLRHLVQSVGALACGVGTYVVVISGLWDSSQRRRGWQDKAAGTIVLRVRGGRTPQQPGALPLEVATHAPQQPAPQQPSTHQSAPPPSPPGSPHPGGGPVPAEPAAPIIAAVPGFSQPGPTASQPADAEPVATSSQPVDDEADEITEVPNDVDRTRLASPAERGDVVLLLPGGERLTVTGDGVLGRNPATPVGQEVPHLVPVADPTRSVSKTHLGFGLDTVGLWVKDLHSTNGTAVVSEDGTRSLLTPGLAVHVMPGDVVVVGDVEVGVTR